MVKLRGTLTIGGREVEVELTKPLDLSPTGSPDEPAPPAPAERTITIPLRRSQSLRLAGMIQRRRRRRGYH